MKQIWLKTALLGSIGLGMTGCATNAGNGALIGGATGAGLGAIASHGHPGGIIVGGAIGAVTGGLIGHEVDRDQAYRDRAYYRDGYYYAPAPYETRTTYVNPDGSTTTYVQRSPGY